MTPVLEEIPLSLMPGVLSNSTPHIVDPEQIKLNDKLRLAENVEFLFVIIGLKTARQPNPTSFEVRAFIKFPTGDLMTLVEERFFIRAEDCKIDPHVVDWCATKTPIQLELLANFTNNYLGIEIGRAENACVGFRVFVKIPQVNGKFHDRGILVTKPMQDIHGLFQTPA